MSDHWDFYFCNVDNKIASFFVDLGIRPYVPKTGSDFMVYLQLYLRSPRADGLTTGEEFDVLAQVDDEIERDVARDGTMYVGRYTTDGCRTFVFYSGSPSASEVAIRSAMARHPEYNFDIGSRPDADWSLYRDFLYPTPANMQVIQNRRVYNSLKDHGDELISPREIDHWIYFNDTEDRERFAEVVRQLGFAVRAILEPEGDQTKRGLQIYRQDTPNPDLFDQVTTQLHELARQSGGDYDGWEAAIVKAE